MKSLTLILKNIPQVAGFSFLSAILLTASCSPKPEISEFSWLTGKWVNIIDSTTSFFEEWQPSKDGMMIGEGSEVKDGKVIFSEKLKIEVRGKNVFYIPDVPENGAPVDFVFTGKKNDSIVFENPEHDFPKRIVYYKISSDSYYVCIDAVNGGKYSKVDFSFQRVK